MVVQPVVAVVQRCQLRVVVPLDHVPGVSVSLLAMYAVPVSVGAVTTAGAGGSTTGPIVVLARSLVPPVPTEVSWMRSQYPKSPATGA
jgi:hypothetical protein